MRIRFLIFVLTALLAAACCALAEGLSFFYAPEVIHPGKAERITLSLPQAGTLTVRIVSSDGGQEYILRDGIETEAGNQTVTFNGIIGGKELSQGDYLIQAESGGESISQPFRIGESAPKIITASASSYREKNALTLVLNVNASRNGQLNALLISPEDGAMPVLSAQVTEGDNTLSCPNVNIKSSGDYTLSLTLTDGAGITGNSYHFSLPLTAPATPKPQPTIRPSALDTQTVPGDYWSMEVGNYDWEAIWQVMISPMTVIKGTGKQAERKTYKLRATPDTNGEIIGLVTCETQGVHVLEALENGWTRIEVYNSSYGEEYRASGKGSGYGMTDELICGYVETSRLDTFTPRTEYGILIDKKTQELYILTENGLLSTLLVSTGFPTAAQPWNETPAGEFYLSSKVGDFPSGNLVCSYGMRFNNGDILHQVPYIYNEKYDLKDFSTCERYLGEKASHGCIRVQRKANDDGINMKWIWDHIPIRTKLLIWDDDNRPDPFMEYPVSPDTVLYYNPTGGKYYHADKNCYSINSRYLPLKGSLTYAQLDDPEFAYLTPCKHCHPPEMRMSEVDAANEENGYW